MKNLAFLHKKPNYSIINHIERKKKDEYQTLFNNSYKEKSNLYFDALFSETKSLEKTEKKEMFKSIIFDTLTSFKMKQEKLIRKNKTVKERNLYFLYRKFTRLFKHDNLKELDLNFEELLNVYRLTETILYNELKLQTKDDEELLIELVELYSEGNYSLKVCTYYNVPLIIWDKVDSNADLFKLHSYMDNSDVQRIIKRMLTNEHNINLDLLADNEANYINKLLNHSKKYLDAFKNRTSTFIFNKKNSNELIKNEIYKYILKLDFTEENKKYLEVLVNVLDYKYKAFLVFYLILYPSEDEFIKKQQDVLLLQRIMDKAGKDKKISDLEVREFVLQKISETNISHRIQSELIEEIFKKMESDSTDVNMIQSSIDFPYLSYAKILKLKFIFKGNHMGFPDFSEIETSIIKQKEYDLDWKVGFLKEMVKTPYIMKERSFQNHILKISEEVLKTNTVDLYKENDFRLFYINPWFSLTERECWQLLIRKRYLQDNIFEFLILKLDEPAYDYLFTNNRITKVFKQRITKIIYQSNLNIESYVHDLADQANEVSQDYSFPPLKKEIIIRKLKTLIY